MSLKVRRVVTGHDAKGKAMVIIDETMSNVSSMRPGQAAAVAWTTQGFPIENDGNEDTAMRPVKTTAEDGTVFRVVKYDPGVTPRMHRTDSVDYAVVISGEIDMELDEGRMVHLKQGDLLVQRGTIHNWVNKGTEPCLIAFVLVSARPATVGGRTLDALG